MESLQIFENKQFGEVRTIEEDGKIMFCGVDVARALSYADAPKAIKTHCKEDGWAIYPVIDSLGREQNIKFISEGNLYRLITHSKKKEAEQFEHWVFDEVLPSIRQTGKYEMPTYLNPASARGVASLINTFARGLKEQGASPVTVATQIERIGRQCGVDVIEDYTAPSPYSLNKQMSLLEEDNQDA